MTIKCRTGIHERVVYRFVQLPIRGINGVYSKRILGATTSVHEASFNGGTSSAVDTIRACILSPAYQLF